MENTNEIQITVSDLALIKSLIDVSCSRGAFKAEEMRTVGEVYDKLTAFLESVIKQAEAAQAEAEEASESPNGDSKGDENA